MWNREPALILGAIQALLAVAIGFGLAVSEEQLALILAATAAVLALVTRSQVTPTRAAPDRHRADRGVPDDHDPNLRA